MQLSSSFTFHIGTCTERQASRRHFYEMFLVSRVESRCRRRGLRFIVLIREDQEVNVFSYFMTKAAHSPQLFYDQSVLFHCFACSILRTQSFQCDALCLNNFMSILRNILFFHITYQLKTKQNKTKRKNINSRLKRFAPQDRLYIFLSISSDIVLCLF